MATYIPCNPSKFHKDDPCQTWYDLGSRITSVQPFVPHLNCGFLGAAG